MTKDQSFDTLLRNAETFIEQTVIPLEDVIPREHWNSGHLQLLEEQRSHAKDLGLWTPQIPREYGGAGLNLYQFGLLNEVLGQSPFGHYICNCQAPDAGNMELLLEYGTQLQKQRFLIPLLKGQIRSCFSMTEKEHAGSNPLVMSTVARRDGDHYVIDGRKWFTTGADGSTFAIVMCQTDSEASAYKRASLIIVPTDTEGFELLRNISVMGSAGSGWASHGEVRYQQCRVPTSFLLGAEGAGFDLAQSRLGPGRIHHCMRWMGICKRALDMMCRRAVSRQLGSQHVLADQQTIQHWIAESKAELEAARLMVLNTARKIDASGSHAARIDISMIKFFCAGVLRKMLNRALQVHGSLGMTDDLVLSYWYRHERAAHIYDGPDEAHKSRVARHLLKSYRS